LAGATVHAFAHAVLTVLRKEPRLVVLRDEVVQVMVRLQNHVAAVPAVTAGRAAFGPERFPEEGHTTFPAMAGARENFYFVDQREQGPVASGADIPAGNEFRPALPDEDAARRHGFAAKPFYSEPFADAVASVAVTAAAFFVSHKKLMVES